MEHFSPAEHFRPPAVGRRDFVERGYRVFAAVLKRVSPTGTRKPFTATVPRVPFPPSEKVMVLSNRMMSQDLVHQVLARVESLR
jgi:hypothetical protein